MMTDRPRDEDSRLDAEEEQFSNDHPLASPNELAGDAASGLELEFAARDLADAEGAASGAALEDGDEVDTLPLEGE